MTYLAAQDAPVEKFAPSGARKVHEAIAPPVASGAILNGSAPLFQYIDGSWNHGEGFGPAGAADTGGWFGHDDGTNVTAADVHTPFGWENWYWSDPKHPAAASGAGFLMKRMYGYLRPSTLARPTVHPLYGDLTTASVAGPFPGPPAPTDHSYVDQAAFEIFRPQSAPTFTDKIVICISSRETTTFPQDRDGRSLGWRQTYMGFFSPDGLIRREPLGAARTPDAFFGNTSLADVRRPAPLIIAINPVPTDYYPIFAYIVPSVMHRQAELNEQRDLQLVQAIKEILKENPSAGRNPLPVALTAAQIDTQVYVVFEGSSNGGLQAMWAALRRPDLVHGALCDSISPSIQRMLNELDMKHAVSRLSGSGQGGTEASEDDMLQWGHYAWNHGLWVHDLSMLQQFLRGMVHRPTCFVVGDEDITSTGTDWIKVLNGVSWTPSGLTNGLSPYGNNAFNRFGWMAGENGCHGASPAKSAYASVHKFHTGEVLHDLILDAIAQKDATAGVTFPLLVAQGRLPNQEFFGLDEPHEWALGRLGAPMTADPGLTRDDAWFHATQPGAAGTMLGYKESMMIRDGALYVGSTEGVVSKFEVDPTSKALVKKAHSNSGGVSSATPQGIPMALGHEAFAMTAMTNGASWDLIVGTRRHLHRLNPQDLSVTQTKQIPWELSRPRHLQVGNLLPDHIHSGDELVFCSPYGGLAFYGTEFTPIWEWSEPGIVDVTIRERTLTILSQRGVVATIKFVDNGSGKLEARLVAASQPIPQPGQYGNVHCQGYPTDLEEMMIDFVGSASPHPVSSWLRGGDGGATRAFLGPGLALFGHVSNLGNISDIATTHQPSGYAGSSSPVGDHLLVLSGSNLRLFDQAGNPRGGVDLTLRQGPGGSGVLSHAAGNGAHALVVGELYDPPGSTFAYADEVVVGTASGALLWLHVQEVHDALSSPPGAPAPLPSPQFDAVVGAAEQPRTNQNLSATWAVSRTAYDQDLHCLDRRGAYWRLSHPGGLEFVNSSNFVINAKGWDDLDNRTSGLADSIGIGSFAPVNLEVYGLGSLDQLLTKPWAPKISYPVYLELTSNYVENNWVRDSVRSSIFNGFAVHVQSGGVVRRAPLPNPAPGVSNDLAEVWYWSGRGAAPSVVGDWGNIVEAYRVACDDDEVTGYWASTHEPSFTGGVPQRCSHHGLRSITTQVEIMNQQAVRVVELGDVANGNGEVVVVLGCPGGRVRVIQPGAMRVDNSTYHHLGSVESSSDLGYGGGAFNAINLTVRPAMARATCVTEDGAHLHSEMASDMC